VVVVQRSNGLSDLVFFFLNVSLVLPFFWSETEDDINPLGLSGMGGVDLSEETSGLRLVHVGETLVRHEWKTLSEF
jgi:hypothetical protein